MTDKHKNGSCNECLFNVMLEHEALEIALNVLENSEFECTEDFDNPNCWSKEGSCKECWRDNLMKKAAERIKGKHYES